MLRWNSALSHKLTVLAVVALTAIFNASSAQPDWQTRLAEGDSSGVVEWEQERLRLEQELGEVMRMAGSQLNDPASLASQRVSDLKERQVSLERRVKMMNWRNLPAETLAVMKAQFEQEKAQLSNETRTTRLQFITRSEEFLKNWKTDPKYSKFRASKTASEELVAQVTLRVAELYALQAIDDYGAAMERWNLAKAGPEPKIEYGRVQTALNTIIKDYPKTQWAADAVYSLAFIESELANPEPTIADAHRETARSLYLKLLEEYGESRYREDANFQLGYYWFSTPPKGVKIAQQLDSAEYYFKEVLVNANSSKAQKSLYMLGWCAFRRPDYAKATNYFEQTVYWPHERRKALGVDVDRISSDAISYLATIFAEPGRIWDGSGVSNALAFVGSDSVRAARYGVKMLEQLGDQMARNLSEFDSAIVAWRGALAIAPMNERAPFIQQKVVESAFRDLKNFDRWYQEGKTLYASYRVESDWWNTNTKARLRKQVKPIVRDNFQQIVAYAVDRATNKERSDYDPKSQEEAVKVCQDFITSFPGDSAAYDWNFQVATLLGPGYLNKPEEAFASYQTVVEKFNYDKYRKPASEQMLLVAEEISKAQLAGQPYAGEVTDTTTGLPTIAMTDLTPGEKLLMTATDNFAKRFPDDASIAPAYLYRAGRINYQRGNIPEANRYFEQLIQGYPKSKYYETAYSNYINGYLVSKDFVGAERVTKEAVKAPISDSLKQFANERMAAAIFSNATTTALSAEAPVTDSTQATVDKAAAYEKAGDDYMRVALEAPNFNNADLALENAAVNYRKAGKLEKVIEAYFTLADKFPKSKRAPRALFNAGVILQSDLKRPADAAKTFDRLVTGFPDGDYDAKQALINASYNYESAQDYSNAVRVNQLYAQRYPSDDVANTLLFKTAGLYLKLNDVAAANRIYDDFARKYPDSPNAVLAYYERGKYAEENRDLATARNQYQAAYDRHLALVGKGKEGNAEYASKSLSPIVRWDFDKYKAIQYSWLPVSKTGTEQRNSKKQQRQDLYQRMSALINLAQPEGFEAMKWLGDLDENLGETHLAQLMPETKKPEEKFDNRRKVIDETIEIYKLAVKSYGEALGKFEQGTAVLVEQRMPLLNSVNDLQKWIDDNTIANPAGLSDSVATLAGRKKALERVEAALTEANRWRDEVREKAPELASRTAQLKQELVNGALSLPDVAVPIPGVKDIMIQKTIYRQQVMQGVVGQFAKELLAANFEAIKVARDAGFEEKWAVPARTYMKVAVDTVLFAATNLNNRWFEIVENYHNAIQELLPRGPEARDNKGRDVFKLGSDMKLAVELYAGEGGVTSIMNPLLDSLLTQLTSDEHAKASMQAAIEDVLGWYNTEAGSAERMYNEMLTAEQAARAKLRETRDPQYEDASLDYETVRLTFGNQQKDLLVAGYDLTERLQINSPSQPMLLAKLAGLDPETYGAKMGIQLSESWAGSDATWIGTDTYIEGYASANLDVSSWKYVSVSALPGVVLDTFAVAKAQPIVFDKANATVPPASKRWYRKAIWIPERVTSAEIRVIGDENVSVFANDVFIIQTEEGADWKVPLIQDVSAQVKSGYNVFAFEVADADGSNGGLIVSIKYRTVPGPVAPQLPEPPNASTVNNISRGVEVTAPAEQPVQQDAQQPVQTPVEQPVEQPVQQETKPVEQPVEQPVQQETKPVEQPVEQPVQQETKPVEQPVEQPVQQETKPVEQPVEQPVQQETKPVEQPVEQPVQQDTKPVEQPVEQPVQQETKPVEQPVEQPVQQETKPVEQPVEQPVQQDAQPVQTPVEQPVAAPADTTTQTPAVQTEPTQSPVQTEPAPVQAQPELQPVATPPDTTLQIPVVSPDSTQQIPAVSPDTTKGQ